MKKIAFANYDLPLTDGWKFHLGELERYDKQKGFVYATSKAGGSFGYPEIIKNKNRWEDVRVPHDWMMSLPVDPTALVANGFKHRGDGWYYIDFTLGNESIERARLVFEGVLGQTVVYVNGTIAGRNFSGYNRFTCEIASYLRAGRENTVALHVDAREWEAWSYEGAGLYRPVYIEFRESTRLDTYDCFVRGCERDGAWTVAADVKAKGTLDGVTLVSTLTSPDGTCVTKEVDAEPSISVIFPVKDAKLWSPENPVLYRFECKLMSGGEVLDRFSSSVGLRAIVWDKDTGMYLNGKKYMVKGICCHQDHGGVGAAVTPEIVEFRISKLKEMGVNAYRCAHHAVPESLLEVCDRLGMLVMVENRHYSVSDDTKKQLEALVRIARNHPCVFIYSLFNEEPWQENERGYRMAREMREWVLSLDDTRAVTGAMNGGFFGKINAAKAMDVVGVNYFNKSYGEIRKLNPEKLILGTENCPTFATRGVYKEDVGAQVFNSYGDKWAEFTVSIEETMKSVEENAFCAGCFAWSGFDSYGEPAPYGYPSIMSHWGFRDICGFAKDTAYLLTAWYKDELCAHLLPHWNWEDGEEVRVCAFTNADTAELFVNGTSVGEIAVNSCRAEWNVPFAKGEIRVIARRGDEQVTDEIRTAGEAARRVLEDVTPVSDGPLVRIINISVEDENGTLLPDCCERIYIDRLGTEVLGIANGNPNGLQANIAYDIELFHGRAQVIVTAASTEVVVRCNGLDSAKI